MVIRVHVSGVRERLQAVIDQFQPSVTERTVKCGVNIGNKFPFFNDMLYLVQVHCRTLLYCDR